MNTEQNRTRWIVVDIEAAEGPTPYSGRMTEFGAADLTTLDTFHGVLWDAVPNPENPATFTITSEKPYDLVDVMTKFKNWLGDGRAVFISDNPAFDFMWIAEAFDRAGMPNPFGFSARRIGDLYAGFSGNWRNTSKWKRYRKTTHDHNPVNDALGNAEALRYILEKHEQRLP